MKQIKFLLALLAFLGLAQASYAQTPANCGINYVPITGVNCDNIRKATYSAVSIGLVPAASATDIFCISGSSSKAISIRKIRISGTAGTLVSAQFTLLHRVTLDTGGTAATGTALPVGAGNNPNNPAATATLTAYTANPTINDSSPTYFRTDYVTLPTTAAGTSIAPIAWEAGTSIDAYSQGFDIPSGATTQQYCINLNATSVSSGVLNITMSWVEQ